MQIRYATKADCAVMVALMQDAFSQYKEEPVPSSALFETEHDVKCAFDNGERALIIENASEIVGMVRYQLVEDSLYFHRLAIRREHQTKGYAKKLLIELELEAISEGKNYVRCRVRANSPKSLALYVNFGYKQYAEQWVEKSGGQQVLVALLEKSLL
ncbi:MAG: GNAT family N-acetyltransferase [Solibacillus sp.]